jgi:sporulation protein YqfC
VKDNMEKFKYNISDILELPKDIMMDLPKITLIGSIQVLISNHKGIIEYTKEVIRVNSNSGVIKVVGKDMYIKIILVEEIIIVGNIEKIEFLN